MSDVNKETRIVRIGNPEGMHVRIVGLLVKRSMRAEATVTLTKDDQVVQGTDALQVLSLGAAEGDTLTLQATGSDAVELIADLTDLLENGPHDG